jgi:hypothetical protein
MTEKTREHAFDRFYRAAGEPRAGFARRLRAADGELVPVANRSRAGRVLEVAGIDHVVWVYPTLHAAVQRPLLEPST